MVPRTVVRIRTRLKSLPTSLASPKSATLGAKSASRRMISGLTSQWMMQSGPALVVQVGEPLGDAERAS